MFNELRKCMTKPKLYAPSTSNFWNDDYISKRLLQAHLDPNWDGATRKPEFLDKSVNWISKIAPSSQYKYLLDLGCVLDYMRSGLAELAIPLQEWILLNAPFRMRKSKRCLIRAILSITTKII